ncbi:PAS-domain containing protein, partial [Klebsiella pneumoniae]|uniref:PAS-domain containing protein n=1 Tax=Klebsiella pneumoniae TaxID=573 RepID=UPI00255387D7
MYQTPAGTIIPGSTLRDAIAQRRGAGSFYGDIDTYVAEIMADVQNRRSNVRNTADGRVIQIQRQMIASGGWIATHEDITERQQVEQKIAHLAHYDTLTDLPNRTLFHELLGRELALTADGKT